MTRRHRFLPSAKTALLVELPHADLAAHDALPQLTSHSALVSGCAAYLRVTHSASSSAAATVFAAGAQLTRVDLSHGFLPGIGDVVPGPFLRDSGISDALAVVVRALLVTRGDSAADSLTSRCRVVCVLRHSPGTALCHHVSSAGHLVDIPTKLSQLVASASRQQQQPPPFELCIVKVAAASDDDNDVAAESLSCDCEAMCVREGQLSAAMARLAATHCCMRRTEIFGVPFRLRNDDGTDAGPGADGGVAVAELWTGAFPEHFLRAKEEDDDEEEDKPLRLYFRPAILGSVHTAADALPCSCAHSVVPVDQSSAATLALLRHVSDGMPVLLSDADGILTHSLVCHPTGQILLHCLIQLPDADQLPIDGYEVPADAKYRQRDFVELMDANTLCLFDPGALPLRAVSIEDVVAEEKEDGEYGETAATATVMAPVHIERQTRFFPWDQADTIVFGSDQYEDLFKLTEQIKRTFFAPKLSKHELEVGCDIVTRLLQCAEANESRLFPPLRTSNSARKDAYRKLWIEVYRFAKSCDTTPEHHVIVSTMERLWGEPLGVKSSTPTITPSAAAAPAAATTEDPPQQEADEGGTSEPASKRSRSEPPLQEEEKQRSEAPQQCEDSRGVCFASVKPKRRQDLGGDSSLLSVFWADPDALL